MMNLIIFLYAGIYSLARRAKDKDFSIVGLFTYWAINYSFGIMFFVFALFDVDVNITLVILINLFLGVLFYFGIKKHYLKNKDRMLLYYEQYFQNEFKAFLLIFPFIVFSSLFIIPCLYFGFKLAILLNL